MMVSTHRKASGVKIAPRRTMASSRHTATSATWTHATPTIATVTYGTAYGPYGWKRSTSSAAVVGMTTIWP